MATCPLYASDQISRKFPAISWCLWYFGAALEWDIYLKCDSPSILLSRSCTQDPTWNRSVTCYKSLPWLSKYGYLVILLTSSIKPPTFNALQRDFYHIRGLLHHPFMPMGQRSFTIDIPVLVALPMEAKPDNASLWDFSHGFVGGSWDGMLVCVLRWPPLCPPRTG